ncbi:MAG: hypothetical protein NC299_12715 [Lachnospiraceae bacterium]|nr:hypothetical protein [Ruminococcus sp.]MCM1276202.1 hypothetical protein [Lachnospiraceae bacterium]
MEIINEASEKFKNRQDELCGFLFDVLKQIDVLEKEICERGMELRRKADESGLPQSQMPPGDKELWEEYRRRMGEIVKPVCTEKLLKRGCAGSHGKPSKYDYINGECTVDFIMKTAARATVIAHFMSGIAQKHKFVLRDVNGKWLIDEVYYGFESDGDKWYVSNIR